MSLETSNLYPVIKATQAGRIAQALLQRNQAVEVLGITSRGVFLALQNGWVVFLSSEPYRGPLTVNLEGSLVAIQVGKKAIIEEGALIFSSGQAIAGIRNAGSWEAPRPAGQAAGSWPDRLEQTSRLVVAQAGSRGLVGLLAPLLGLSPPVELDPRLVSATLRLRAALQAGDQHTAHAKVESFLGLGSGLTPSGDDVVLGLLLALNRIPTQASLPGRAGLLDEPGFGEAVVQAARRRTTSLSASLIACAAQGQADERLVSALDGIYTGSLLPQESAERLLSWGHSSGGDALVGMCIGIGLDFKKE